MKKLNLMIMSIFLLGTPAAFAKNLGQLSEHQLPKNLISANDLLNINDEMNGENENNDSHNYYRRGHGYGDYDDYGYGGYYPGYYGYGYGYGSGYYGGYYPYYYLHESAQLNSTNRSGGRSRSLDSAAEVSAVTPVVCFASDSLRNWYMNVGSLSDAPLTQQSVNRECLAADASCIQNLGCAIAVDK